MAEIILLASTGSRLMQEALHLAEKQPFVVFSTLDRRVLSQVDELLQKQVRVKTCFYETG